MDANDGTSTRSTVAAVADNSKKFYKWASSNPTRAMKVFSSVSGLLLVLTGITGLFDLFNPLRMVISFYNIVFGLLILLTELKSWPIIATLQKRVDAQFHLLSVPKGKGGFYCFVGVLGFCAAATTLEWVCFGIIAVVGAMHFIPRFSGGSANSQDDEIPNPQQLGLMPAVGSAAAPGQADPGLAGYAMKVLADTVKDNPQMVQQGLQIAASNPQAMSSAYGAATQPTQSQPR